MARIRANFVAGALDAALAAGGTSMSSPALADLPVVASPDIAAISLFVADVNGRITKKEIVYVTAHTASATTATITRGRESTTDQAWSSGDKWEHAMTTEEVVSWQQIINDDASSLTPWTAVAGTWAANAGGYIEQTATTAAYLELRRTTKLGATHAVIIEAEIRFPSAGQPAGDLYAGFALTPEGSEAGGPACRLMRTGGAWKVEALTHETAVRTTRAWSGGALDTWFKFRMVAWGDVVSVYIAGTHFLTSALGANGALDYLNLWVYGTLAHFDNVKVWQLGGLPV